MMGKKNMAYLVWMNLSVKDELMRLQKTVSRVSRSFNREGAKVGRGENEIDGYQSTDGW